MQILKRNSKDSVIGHFYSSVTSAKFLHRSGFLWSLLPRLSEQGIPLEREGDCWVEQAILLSITASYTPVALSARSKVVDRLRTIRFVS